MLKKSMKKALTLKLIASFIITFLFYKYNVISAHADSKACSVGDCECITLSVTVNDSSAPPNPVSSAFVSVTAQPFVSPQLTDSSGVADLDIRDISGNRLLFNISGPIRIEKAGSTAQVALEHIIQTRPHLTGSFSCSASATLSTFSPGTVLCPSGVSGTVQNNSGTGIEGAYVSIGVVEADGSPGLRGTNTGNAGHWSIGFPNLSVANITITAAGFQSKVLPAQCDTGVVRLTPSGAATACDEIRGKVKDSFGNAVQGARVFIDGGNTGVTTDVAGAWSYDGGGTGFTASVVSAERSGATGSTTNISLAGSGLCVAGDIIISSAGGPGGPGGPGFPGANLPTAAVPEKLMGNIQLLAIAIGTIIAIIRIILGALQIAGGGDNPIALEAGRDMITSSILGLLVILFAVTLLRVIGSSVLGIIN